MTEQGNKVVRAAGVVAAAMIASRILGYLRDVFIYAQFGQNRITDAYQAAFSIPDFIYMILVGGALSASFIPIFSSYVAKGQEEEAWETASIVLNVVCAGMLVLLSAAYIFAPQLINILVPGFDAASKALTVTLTRIMLLQVVFLGLAGIIAGILQSYKIFGPTAYGSVIYNLGIIVVGVAFSGYIEAHWRGFGIAAFSIGVVVGAFFSFIVQAFALRKVGIRYHFSFNIKHPGFRKVIMLMIPVFIGLSVSQFNLFVNQNLASGLDAGLVAALRTAQRFMQLPVAIFAISIAIALFPTLTTHAAREEVGAFRRDFSSGIRSIIFITVPCSVLLAVLAVPVMRFVFEFSAGKFDAASTANTAFALYFYCIGIFAYGAIHLASRAFYAYQDTKTPVLLAAVAVVVNIVLSLIFVRVLAQGGLALAYSLAGIINFLLLMIFLKRKLGQVDGKHILISAGKTTAVSLVMGLVALLLAELSALAFGTATKLTQGVQVMGAGLGGVLVFFLLAKLIRMEEADAFLQMMKRRFKRRANGS